jgi:hypothetical protein
LYAVVEFEWDDEFYGVLVVFPTTLILYHEGTHVDFVDLSGLYPFGHTL